MSNIPWDKIFSLTWADGVKLLVSALVILFVTKIQLFHDRLSALLIALPLTSIIAMVWMRGEGQEPSRIANHAEATFWFVLPTLPMFLLLPWLLRHGWGFTAALAACCVLTTGLFLAMLWILKPFGVRLL